MNLLSPGNFSPCDAGNETISNKSCTGKENMFCDWHTLSVSLMLIFKTNEDECNDKMFTLYMHFKKHSSNRYSHAEYYWIRYEYVVVFSCTRILTGPCRHNVCVNSVLVFTFYLLKHFCKRALYAFANIVSDGFVVLFCCHQQQDILLKSLRRSIKMADVTSWSFYTNVYHIVRVTFIHVRFVK